MNDTGGMLPYSSGAEIACSLICFCSCNASWLEAVVVLPPVYIFSIFLLSSWAREKVMRTMTKSTTTKFFSDKIAFISSL